jgi:hypothetical protein
MTKIGTFSTTVVWYWLSLCFRVSLSRGEMHGFRAASFHRLTKTKETLEDFDYFQLKNFNLANW